MVQQQGPFFPLFKIRNERGIVGRSRCPEFNMTFDFHFSHCEQSKEDKTVIVALFSDVKLPDPERWMAEVFLSQPFRTPAWVSSSSLKFLAS